MVLYFQRLNSRGKKSLPPPELDEEKDSAGNYDHDSKALQKAILSWTKKNYARLHSYNPRVAEACLVDGITYDVERFRLIKTSPAEGLRREPNYVYLEVDKTL